MPNQLATIVQKYPYIMFGGKGGLAQAALAAKHDVRIFLDDGCKLIRHGSLRKADGVQRNAQADRYAVRFTRARTSHPRCLFHAACAAST